MFVYAFIRMTIYAVAGLAILTGYLIQAVFQAGAYAHRRYRDTHPTPTRRQLEQRPNTQPADHTTLYSFLAFIAIFITLGILINTLANH